ncbi:hypothetical protein H0H93_010546 [Arthromyces matolae]|nr:hypothetical protein H0H93_010546 [Arthromyces matolae]
MILTLSFKLQNCLTLVYAHFNRIIKKTGLNALYVVGPGHGAPAILSCLWLEDSLGTFLPEYSRNYSGIQKLITRFSVPGGFPSHINAQTPGAIHEGGELGYALSVSFGAVMDNPDLVVACVIGDGEAETGPTATAWHAIKYIDPAESGAVIPILHVNGFKISERTIFGVMDNKEITALFTGYGYHVRIVDNIADIHNDLAASLDWALSQIKDIQQAARSGQPIVKPRWPMIVLRTPKGWTGPKKLRGEFVEGSFRSHQVPLPEAKTDPEELQMLQKWLESYGPKELFKRDGSPTDAIMKIVPEGDKRMGMRIEAHNSYQPLHTPNWRRFALKPGEEASCMKVIGQFLKEVVVENPKTFRIFSPDELVSNKLDAVFDVTGRNFQWDVASRGQGGRVIEILSEHTCQGMLQGYTLTGRTGLFPSYEAFLGIIHTMMVQYSKFCKMAEETSWRHPCGSLNYLETSTWTRQEHNGFSHQNPSFIGAVLNLKAKREFSVIVGIGVAMTFEVIAAAALLRKVMPALRVRVVNVTDLMILSPFGRHPHALTQDAFDSLFTADRHVHFNYHGYPIELRGLLGGRGTERISIEGYSEEGTTTSPFDMMLANHTSRYDVAIAAIRGGGHFNKRVAVDAHEVVSHIKHMAQKEREYIYKHGKDHDDTFAVPKFD